MRCTDDTYLVAYKETTQKTGDGNLELEFEVFDKETVLHFLKKVISEEKVRHQQKRRRKYRIIVKDTVVVVDIDFWPLIPPYIEIESTSRGAIDQCISMLGLNGSDATELDAMAIYDSYGVTIKDIKELVFDATYTA